MNYEIETRSGFFVVAFASYRSRLWLGETTYVVEISK